MRLKMENDADLQKDVNLGNTALLGVYGQMRDDAKNIIEEAAGRTADKHCKKWRNVVAVNHSEQGWGGHFICADRCAFRRNTLVETSDGHRHVIVSTVGLYQNNEGGIEEIGCERDYETMAFEATFDDPYWHADVSRQIHFKSPWAMKWEGRGSDLKANEMHETVVREMRLTLWEESWNNVHKEQRL